MSTSKPMDAGIVWDLRRQGPPPLHLDDIHVWSFALDASDEALHRYHASLSDAERTRAVRFLSQPARRGFIIAHGVLRAILSRYCDLDPGALRFALGAAGKPVLAGPSSGRCQFNLSHSHGGALLAVSCGRLVGVDLERVREGIEYVKLAKRFFAQIEHRHIVQAPSQEQRALFFRYWVCKEAVLKGLGIGLRVALRDCEVRFGSDGVVGHVSLLDSKNQGTAWTARLLPLEDGWTGAVAAEGSGWRPQLYRCLGSI